ncbi:Uncharacterized protein PECH_004437 [Penicillium ucsense]|uniref:Pentacotripeptide-repeat region of PRORP domain-containing protein n=1 Tax=Penicillium ucsense TaxID=2839758 RepID=A0A8J8W876_9EURO|nr:Uncharacterized protein PECM_003225 [Penicillium ucsense]KAF7737117.1 Uncharacterized protein PECH_004437 [Penicillium ucsense]
MLYTAFFGCLKSQLCLSGVMLERAAGCLESAGRRFLRDSNSTIRSRKSLSRNFWKQNAVIGDVASFFFALALPLSHQSSTCRFRSQVTRGPERDGGTPFLDFLYPRRSQELAIERLKRHGKRFGLRRRKRALVGFSRSYASNATSPSHYSTLEEPHTTGPQTTIAGLEATRSSEGYLLDLLAKQKADFDRAWVLYIAAGRPSSLRSALCAYLSRSTDQTDRDRAWKVFQEIPEAVLGENDFLHAAESQLGSHDPSKLLTLSRNWKRTLEVWRLVTQFAEYVPGSPYRKLISELEQGRLSWDAVALGKFVARSRNPDGRLLAGFILDHIFRYSYMLRSASTGILVELFRVYHDLDALKPEYYLKTLGTFQASEVRSVFIRTIVFYRIMRRQMPDLKPPQSFYTAQLRAFAQFGITSGIRYFLDEMRHFYGMPHLQIYKDAMQSFAYAGDAEQVNFLFNKMVEDHGAPRSRKLLAPLLDVYARLGNVQETKRQFGRISDEFHLEPNDVCWNIVLKAYAHEENLAGALSTYSQMKQAGVFPSAHTFGTLMALFARRGDIDNTRRLLKEAERHGVEITMPMLEMVVQAYCANGLLPQAEQFAVACQDFNVKGSPIGLWNTLLFQHALRVDFVAMNRVWQLFKSAGIKPDAVSYASHMLILALVGKTDRARKTLRDLHKKRVFQATDLHYAIILFGYLKSRNRTMVQVIFKEIEERFGQDETKSSLLELRDQIELDMSTRDPSTKSSAELRLKNAEHTLLTSLTSIDRLTKGIKLPPSKSHVKAAFLDSFYTYRIKNLGLNGAIDEARQLFDEYFNKKRTFAVSESGSESAPLRLISAMMLAYLQAEQYVEVEKCWQLAFSNTVKVASRVDIEELMRTESLGVLSIRAATHESQSATGQLSTPSTPNTSSDAQPSQAASSDNQKHTRESAGIIPSQRYTLSRPLSIYMRALAYQSKAEHVVHVVAELELLGFQLSTFNWSTYVQMLAASDRFDDILEAFRAFERHFMPNFPDWKRLQAGQGIKPLGVPFTIQQLEDSRHFPPPSSSLGKASRTYWSNIDPGFMQPTYVSMVYLAAAVDRIRSQSILKGGEELERLHAVAPKTITEIGRMPYLRDKFQGVLIRHRSHQADKDRQKHFRRQSVAASGILGIRPRKGKKKTTQGSRPSLAANAQAPTVETTLADLEAARSREAILGPSPVGSEDDVFTTEDRVDLDSAIRGRHARQVYLHSLRAATKRSERKISDDQLSSVENAPETSAEVCQDTHGDEISTEFANDSTGYTQTTSSPQDEKKP